MLCLSFDVKILCNRNGHSLQDLFKGSILIPTDSIKCGIIRYKMTSYEVGKGNGVQIVRHSKYISYDIYISRKCNYWNQTIHWFCFDTNDYRNELVVM